MAASRLEPLQTRLETVIALSRLLERVEANNAAIGADQYRALVRQLQSALATPLPEPALEPGDRRHIHPSAHTRLPLCRR